MIKRVFVFSLLVVGSSILWAQNPYYDAVFLRKLIGSDGKFTHDNMPDADIIFSHYLTGDQTISREFGKNNLFIRDLFPPDEPHSSLAPSRRGATPLLSSVDVTNFSQGVSLFLIGRAKEELNIAFFYRLKKVFEKHPELAILFPETTDHIVNILEFKYAEVLPVLQAAFNKDMENLPENMIELLLLPEYYKKIQDFPEFLLVLNSYKLIRQINFLSPVQVIDSLSNIAVIKGKVMFPNVYSTFRLSSLFSHAILADKTDPEYDPDRLWVEAKKFYHNILSDTTAAKLFIGLIYQQIKNEPQPLSFNNIPVIQLIDSFYLKRSRTEIYWFNTQFTKLIRLTEDVNNTAKELTRMNQEHIKLEGEDYYNFMNKTIDIAEFGYDLAMHYKPGLAEVSYFNLAREVDNLYFNTLSGRYTMAFHNAAYILNTLQDGTKDKLFEPRLLDFINTYGIFIANISDAKSPEEVKSAIENAALPTGSSSFKKYNRFNLAINGYIGPNFNLSYKNNAGNSWNRQYNLTAPVGLNLSLLSLKSKGSFSFFVPIIDVGAIANFQMKNDSTFEQKIYLSNIFSPGVYVVYGFPGNLPLSLAFGGQYGPGLTRVGSALNAPSWRWTVSVTVDIPVINMVPGRRQR